MVALLLAALLGSSRLHVAAGGVVRPKRSNNDDLTEDIGFWTRMQRNMQGSMPETGRPTNFPVPETPMPVTPMPMTNEPVPVTPVPSPLSTTIPPGPTPTNPPVDSCGLTPEQRAQQFRELALTVTDASTLDNSDSAQARALDWLVNEDALDPPVCPDDGECKALQRYIMASFYFASGGGSWDQCNAPDEYTPAAIAAANAQCDRVVTPFPVNNPRIGDTATNAWLTPVNECEWGGLACWGTTDNRRFCMDQIDFENDGLSGSLIPEMANLDQLRFFILEQGSISGQIPTEYGLFDKLLIFDMDFNDLTGEIPDELFNMELLQQLDLNDNELTGPISTRIGQMNTLTFLQLDHNELNGNIPTEVGNLKALREYYICHCFHFFQLSLSTINTHASSPPLFIPLRNCLL